MKTYKRRLIFMYNNIHSMYKRHQTFVFMIQTRCKQVLCFAAHRQEGKRTRSDRMGEEHGARVGDRAHGRDGRQSPRHVSFAFNEVKTSDVISAQYD